MFHFYNPFPQSLETQVTRGQAEFIKALTLKRVVCLILGLFFLGIAAVGVVLPGVPTTGPLLAASFFLTKSCPVLENRLIRNRFFGRYLQYLGGDQPIPSNVRRNAILAMWLSITVSCYITFILGYEPWKILCILVGGVLGHICIRRFRLNPRSED